MKQKIVLIGMGVILMVMASPLEAFWKAQTEAKPIIQQVVSSSSPVPSLPPTTLPTVTATPEPVLVKQYLLDDKVNLSTGTTALTIRLDEKTFLPGNWAEAIAYSESDTAEVFKPYRGTIYSLLGDTTILRAHSGTMDKKPELFASNIDLYLRKEDGQSIDLATGKEKAAGMIGDTAFICQVEKGGKEVLTPYDVSLPCPGKQLELKIVAMALVPREMVADYDAHLLSLRSWLIASLPEANFSSLNPKTGFLLITCVGKYKDQPILEEIPSYDYNRLVIGFEIVH